MYLCFTIKLILADIIAEMRAVLALSLLCLLFGASAAWDPINIDANSVRLPLYQKQYIQVRVGDPGRVLVLRLRWDHDLTFLYDRPESYSATFTDTSDIFYLKHIKVRLPVVYGLETAALIAPNGAIINDDRRVDTSGGVSHQGSLGLGRNSPLWHYWSGFTLSQHTLTLGEYDTLDVLNRNPGRIESTLTANGESTLRADFLCHGVAATSEASAALWTLNPDLAYEFSYLPASIFRPLKTMLDDAEEALHPDERHKAAFVMSSGANDDTATNNTFWLGLGLSYITTSYGSHERVIRMSEGSTSEQQDTQVPADSITLGRLHLLEQHVYSYDRITGTVRIEHAFDTYPLMESGMAPQGWVPLVALAMWVLWRVEAFTMAHQWIHSGIAPQTRRHVKQLERLAAMSKSWFSHESVPTETTTTAAKRIGDDPHQTPSSQEIAQDVHSPLSAGPLDWTIVPSLLFAVRIVCVPAMFVAVFGFRAARFAEQIALLAYLPAVLGDICYYAAIVVCLSGPLVVNTFFLRRLTGAGAALVYSSLLAAAWLTQLPDTDNYFFRLLFNLEYATMLCIRLAEWPMQIALRGMDTDITNRIVHAGEYNTDVEFMTNQSRAAEDAQHFAERLRAMPSQAAETLQRAVDASTQQSLLPSGNQAAYQRKSPSKQAKQKPPAAFDVHSKYQTTNAPETILAPAGNLAMLEVYRRRERFVARLWILGLLPMALMFLICLNVLPMIEYFAPQHPLRYPLAFIYALITVVFLGFLRSASAILQVAREHIFVTRRVLLKVVDKASAEGISLRD
jgi:hypothetical protein